MKHALPEQRKIFAIHRRPLRQFSNIRARHKRLLARARQNHNTHRRILARIQDQDVKDKLLKNTEASVARGTFGSPTFFVGEEIFFGKDRLRDVEEEIEAVEAGGNGDRV